MTGLLKILIAVACVCVIAACGWYLYSERQLYLAEQKAREIEERITQEQVKRLRAEIDKANKETEARRAQAKAAIEESCAVRVPSQSTENLKNLYQQCIKDNDPETMCRNSLNSSALGDAKRLRDWCRQNGYISYQDQLKAEGVSN